MSIKRSVFRKYYLIILLVSLVFLLSACFQQSTIPQAKPAQQPNVFDQYISVQAIEPDLAGLESNLFQNGDFEDAIGWIPCESASDFSIIEDEDRKSRVLQTNTEGCFYQSVAVQDLDKVNLSCFAKAPSGDLWTGMGLSFSDSSWNAVGEEVSKVFTDASSYNSQSIISDVPNNAEYASMWFYSDGKARVDDCVLKDLPTFGNGEENSDYVAENINLVQNNDGTATLKGRTSYW